MPWDKSSHLTITWYKFTKPLFHQSVKYRIFKIEMQGLRDGNSRGILVTYN